MSALDACPLARPLASLCVVVDTAPQAALRRFADATGSPSRAPLPRDKGRRS